jgi:hypothetical protein
MAGSGKSRSAIHYDMGLASQIKCLTHKRPWQIVFSLSMCICAVYVTSRPILPKPTDDLLAARISVELLIFSRASEHQIRWLTRQSGDKDKINGWRMPRTGRFLD